MAAFLGADSVVRGHKPFCLKINKHVFLRGYLEGVPKHLVDGIAVTAETYEDTKRILHTKYGDNIA